MDKKEFIFISNDKKTNTIFKIDYRGFGFFDDYGLKNIAHKIVDDLIFQFDIMAGNDNFFQRESFAILVESNQEIVKREFEGKLFYFLKCNLMFPPQALSHYCSFCWEILENGEIKAYWTSDFPKEELKQYVEKIK